MKIGIYDTAAISELFMTRSPRVSIKFSDKPVKAAESRLMREFTIKGHNVTAYSKKDAITRLKHQKNI